MIVIRYGLKKFNVIKCNSNDKIDEILLVTHCNLYQISYKRMCSELNIIIIVLLNIYNIKIRYAFNGKHIFEIS